MGCNCGKRRKPVQPQAPAPAPAPEPSKGETQKFALELPNGVTQQFGSQLEASAARARLGGRLLR